MKMIVIVKMALKRRKMKMMNEKGLLDHYHNWLKVNVSSWGDGDDKWMRRTRRQLLMEGWRG